MSKNYTGPFKHQAPLGSSPDRLNTLLLACVLLIGAGLRLYHLGFYSLWSDEVAGALVAVSPTFKGLLEGVRSHIMEMPLDYVLVWGIIRFNLNEFFLRLPVAIFGIMTLAISFRLLKKLGGPKVALLSVFFLALSPVHLYFSQELRSYSSMLFFYILSTTLLLETLQAPTFTKWLIFTFVTILGMYFHVYVIFAVINGFILWLWIYPDRRAIKPRLFSLCASLLIIGLAFLPWYLYLGTRQSYGDVLLPNGVPLLKVIGYGMGWIEQPYTVSPGLGQLWYGICFGLVMVGWLTRQKGRRRVLAGMAVSGIIQICLVVLADWIKGYWFLARQILFLIPFGLFFSATGGVVIQEWLLSLWNRFSSRLRIDFPIQRWLNPLLIFSMILVSIPALQDYYQWPKSTAREIITMIVERWTPNSTILLIPGFQERTFRYYLQYVYKNGEIASRIEPITLLELPDINTDQKLFLVYADYQLEASTPIFQQFLSAGFHPLVTTDRLMGLSLFLRPQDALR